MSQPVSLLRRPFDVAHHPSLEPEVERATLARWAFDHSAVSEKPTLRRLPGAHRATPVDHLLAALRALDEQTGGEGASPQ